MCSDCWVERLRVERFSEIFLPLIFLPNGLAAGGCGSGSIPHPRTPESARSTERGSLVHHGLRSFSEEDSTPNTETRWRRRTREALIKDHRDTKSTEILVKNCSILCALRVALWSKQKPSCSLCLVHGVVQRFPGVLRVHVRWLESAREERGNW